MRLGAVFKDYREVWVPGPALGPLHHAERRLSAQDAVAPTRQLHFVNFLLRQGHIFCVKYLE